MKSHIKEQGSAHVVVIVVLVAAVLGLLGFVFWQNFLMPKDDTTVGQTVTQEEAEEDVAVPEAPAVPVSKTQISAAMNSDYKNLSANMISPIDGAISNSDGFFQGKTSEELSTLIGDYFAGITGWTFTDYKDLNNEKLTAQLKASSFTDYATSYIGTASSPSRGDVFIAFTLNDQGLITYAFWGGITGF